MTNATLQVIDTRRSVRHYAEKALTQAEKDAILEAAFRAPTAGNQMLYSIIEVEDLAIKEQLVETCDHQPFIAKAPFLLLFLADYQRWFDAFLASGVEERCQIFEQPMRKPGMGDMMLACCDALIAAQNAVIAAQSLGIGSCYIGDILENYEIHRQMFNLPQYAIPVTLICFGYPAVDMPEGRTRRFNREFIVHRDTYRRFNGDEITRMMQPMEERFRQGSGPALNAVQGMYFRKFASDFSMEMTRSVGEMLKTWQGDD